MTEPIDALGRPEISPSLKQAIEISFQGIPAHKRGSLVLIADKGSDKVYAHVAAKFGENWKVAGGAGWEWGEKSPDTAFVAIVGHW